MWFINVKCWGVFTRQITERIYLLFQSLNGPVVNLPADEPNDRGSNFTRTFWLNLSAYVFNLAAPVLISSSERQNYCYTLIHSFLTPIESHFLNVLFNNTSVSVFRGGTTIGVGEVMHPHLFKILVFLLYWPPPTFQCTDPHLQIRITTLVCLDLCVWWFE